MTDADAPAVPPPTATATVIPLAGAVRARETEEAA